MQQTQVMQKHKIPNCIDFAEGIVFFFKWNSKPKIVILANFGNNPSPKVKRKNSSQERILFFPIFFSLEAISSFKMNYF